MTTLRARKEDKPSTAPGSLQLVTFQVGAAEFGLDIHAITEVIRPLPITALPRMPRSVEGVIELRGDIIPVVDLRRRFGVEGGTADSRKTRMLITRGAVPGALGGGGLLGLVVDGVREVLQLSPTAVGRAPEAATGSGAEFIAGVAKVADRLVILLDLAKVLSREERAVLTEAGDVHP